MCRLLSVHGVSQVGKTMVGLVKGKDPLPLVTQGLFPPTEIPHALLLTLWGPRSCLGLLCISSLSPIAHLFLEDFQSSRYQYRNGGQAGPHGRKAAIFFSQMLFSLDFAFLHMLSSSSRKVAPFCPT